MSPRSLLFCSSRETSLLLSRFLRDLRFEVEYCPEIFEAVKRLTARPHELVVIDWDEGPEARFLLKTVRELKTNRDAFVIALAKPEAVANARHAGANEVVTKAQVSEEIKNSLVSSRDFLSGLERRFAMSGAVPGARPARPGPALPRPERPAWVTPPHNDEEIVPLPLASQVDAVLPARNTMRTAAHPAPSFASVDPDSSTRRFFQGMAARLESLTAPTRFNHRRNVYLRRAAMLIAFFVTGYVASQPFSQAGASLAEMYQDTVGVTPVARHVSRTEFHPAAPVLRASLREKASLRERDREVIPSNPAQDNSGMNVEVTPLYNDPLHRPEAVKTEPKTEPQIVDTSAASNSPAFPEPEAEPERPRDSHVPQSLTSQFPGGASIRNVAERISPAILGALEPVNLPGYLAEKLLVDKVDPSYPAQALRSGLQGPVVLQAWIGKDGKIRNLKLVRGPFLLGEAAYQAVKQWRYQPYLLNGEAVETQTYVTVDFRLP